MAAVERYDGEVEGEVKEECDECWHDEALEGSM